MQNAEVCEYVHLTRINFVSSESNEKLISACEHGKACTSVILTDPHTNSEMYA